MKNYKQSQEERNKKIDKVVDTLEKVNNFIDPLYKIRCTFKGLLIMLFVGIVVCVLTFAALQNFSFALYVILLEALVILYMYFYYLHAFWTTEKVENIFKNAMVYGKEDVAISYEVKRCLSKYRTAQLFIGGALTMGVKSYKVKITYRDEQGISKTVKHIYSFIRKKDPNFTEIRELPIKVNNGIAHIDIEKLGVEVWL